MANYIGIDLGTTFSAVAYIDKTGRPQIVNNDRDQNITPSVVAKHKGDLIVGEFARKHWGNDDRKGAARFKRDMGTSTLQQIDGSDYSPTELSAAVLKALKKQTEERIGPITDAVVTIPANFSNEARDATMEAAKMAGLDVKYIINEPTAAALYYAYHSDGDLSGSYVVFDLGGGTFDVSIIKVTGQDVEVLSSNGVHKLGGADFDLALWKIVAQKYQDESGQVLTTEEFSMNDAEDAKKSISERKKTTVEIEREFVDLSRVEFEEAISSMLAQIEMMCETTLDEAGIDVSDISDVFLAGGSTRMPVVRDIAQKVFQREPSSTVNVDEVVALGASLYAAHKSDGSNLSEIQKKSIDQLKVAERTNCFLGTITVGHSESKGQIMMNSVLIKKGESIPCEIRESYSTVHEGQEAISCTITESKSPETDPRFVKIIHEESLDLPPGRPANQEIVVTYAYDENQMIHASFKDVESGNEKIISISMAGKNKTSPDIDKFLVD
jgi:molecular chaperone DnaK|tara:strand:+ start:1019 stop:2509 length:1491 start_codon:yes stop_codon:yes gene_type:complete